MKRITMYELMGLIKDNKAPKKIKHENVTYEFNKNKQDYENDTSSFFLYYKLGKTNNIKEFLSDTVEILPEENDEWEDIEEIDILQDILSTDKIGALIENIGEIQIIDDFAVGNLTELNSKVINKLIKNQKYLKEKLESKDE